MMKPVSFKKKQPYDKETTRSMTKELRRLSREVESRDRILRLMFQDPLQEFALSKVAESARTSKSTASRIIVRLHDEGLVKLIKSRLVWRISANIGNPNFKREKILYNLSLVFRSGVIDFLDGVFNRPKSIILFGSFSKGEDNLDSDIDIAIEGEVSQIIKMKELEELEKEIGRSISIHLFRRDDVDINLFNSIANGIILSGFLEVKK